MFCEPVKATRPSITASLRWLRRSSRVKGIRQRLAGRTGKMRTPCCRSQGAKPAEEPPRADARRPARGTPRPRCAARAKASATCRPTVVVLEDVEQQVDVMPGGVDVGDQPVDDHVGVGHQGDRVAGHHRQPADVLGHVDQHAVLVGLVGSTMWSGSTRGYSEASNCGRRLRRRAKRRRPSRFSPISR